MSSAAVVISILSVKHADVIKRGNMVEYGFSARMYLRIEMSCCYALSLRFRRLPERGWSWRSGLLVYPVGREVDRTAKERMIA